MILQALNDYYHRLLAEPSTDIPALGFSSQKIHFALVLEPDGKLRDVQDLRMQQGNQLAPRIMVVPEPAKRTASPRSNFMWDNAGYVLGADLGPDQSKVRKNHEVFKEFHEAFSQRISDPSLSSLMGFLRTWKPEDAVLLDLWEEIAGCNLVFRLDGETEYFHEKPVLQEAWINFQQDKKSERKAFCLVTGKRSAPARLHPAIKGVAGAQSSGAALISFNLDSFKSFGKDQNFNAPVSEEAAFNYTTVLNHLLAHGNPQKIRIGDATTVFWAEKDTPMEGFMGLMLDPGQAREEEEQKIRLFLEEVRSGKLPRELEPDVKFFILGLSPNAARISVRFWLASTTGALAKKIGMHYQDLAIVRRFDTDPEFPSLWALLRETAALGKSENVSPHLAGALAKSVLSGAPYPQGLLWAVLARVRAGGDLNYLRASLIKAVLARKNRSNNTSSEEVTMSLNKESANAGYLLGRLFAVLEKAQKDALGNVGATIKDRYFGSASSTPRAVFPNLVRLAQHHLAKSDFGPLTDRLIQEIMQGIDSFPAHLSLDDQGFFALGYYHQKQDLYTKKENKEEK